MSPFTYYATLQLQLNHWVNVIDKLTFAKCCIWLDVLHPLRRSVLISRHVAEFSTWERSKALQVGTWRHLTEHSIKDAFVISCIVSEDTRLLIPPSQLNVYTLLLYTSLLPNSNVITRRMKRWDRNVWCFPVQPERRY